MYGKWLYKEIGTEYGACMVEIYRKNYTGESIEIGALAADSLTIALENLGNITDPIGKSVCSFSIIDTDQVEYDDFFTPDATALKVIVSTRVGSGAFVIRWSGYVTPDFFAENLSYRTPISISARDNIGYLNDVDFDLTATTITVREFIQSAFRRIAEDYPMSLSFATQKQTAEGILAIDATISTTLLRDMTWGEALETILHDLGLQMRWVDNNTIAVLDISQIPEYYQTQGFNFIEASGYREIVPAWRELSQEQDYGLIENFFRGRISEEDLTFVKEEQVVISSYNTSTMKYYSPKNWLGNGLTINYNDYFFSVGGTMSESERNRIYFTGISKDTTAYIDKFMGWRQPVYKSNNAMKISFKALNSIQVVSQYSLPGMPFLQTFGPYSPGTAQFGLKVNVLLHTATKTYIMRYNWEELNADETDAINFVLPVLQGNAYEEECVIDIGNIPYDGELELRIYGWYFIEATNWTSMPLNAVSYITDVVYSYDTGGAITGRDAKVQVSELHNIKNDNDYSFGEVPLDCGGINAYAGGLFKADGNELIGFQRNADATNYNLLELVGRELIHFNKRNYNRLSGTIRNLNKEPLMFNRLFVREGKKYAPYNYSLSVISNEMNITSMQEVEPYETAIFNTIDSQITTGGGTVSGGNNTILQYSEEAGNEKRLFELQTATEQEKSDAYVLVDKAGFPEARKMHVSELGGIDVRELEQYLESNGYAALKRIWEVDSANAVVRTTYNVVSEQEIISNRRASGSGSGGGGGISEITAQMVVDALGYLPYSSLNPAGYITSSALNGYAKTSDIPSSLPASDVYDWAKAATKPSYTASEVGALSTSGGTITGDLSLNQYLRINAWSGYGSGSCDMWYNGTNGILSITAQNITNYWGDTFIHSGNIGSQSVNYANSANYSYGLGVENAANVSSELQYMQFSSQNDAGDLPTSDWWHVIKMGHGNADTYFNRTLAFSFWNNRILTRNRQEGIASDWEELAFLSSNVASATKLQTGRYFWGNYFNGESGVSGNPEYNYRGHLFFYNSAGSLQSAVYADNTLYLGMGYTNSSTIVMGGAVHLRYGSGTDGLVVNNQGNILIGTTTDNGSRLNVNGGITATEIIKTNSAIVTNFYGNATCGLYPDNWITGDGNNNRLWLYNDNNLAIYGKYIELKSHTYIDNRLTINFGIDAIDPTAQAIAINAANGATSFASWPGIGFHIPGITYATIKFGSDTCFHFMNYLLNSWVDVKVGNLVATGEVISSRRASSSDARLKDNINRLIAEDCLAMVRNLQPSSWRWKEDGKFSLGFIAQDIEPLMPYAVTRIKDEELEMRLNLQYDQFFAPIVGAIQCLDIKVNSHEDEIESLKNEVAELKQRLSKYETVWQ